MALYLLSDDQMRIILREFSKKEIVDLLKEIDPVHEKLYDKFSHRGLAEELALTMSNDPKGLNDLMLVLYEATGKTPLPPNIF